MAHACTMIEEEKKEAKLQISEYKELRELIQYGDMYRLLNPFKGNETAWMFVSEDKTEAFVSYFRVLAVPNGPVKKLTLRGLDPDADYKVTGKDDIYGGDELMYAGLSIPELKGDYCSVTWRIKRTV